MSFLQMGTANTPFYWTLGGKMLGNIQNWLAFKEYFIMSHMISKENSIVKGKMTHIEFLKFSLKHQKIWISTIYHFANKNVMVLEKCLWL